MPSTECAVLWVGWLRSGKTANLRRNSISSSAESTSSAELEEVAGRCYQLQHYLSRVAALKVVTYGQYNGDSQHFAMEVEQCTDKPRMQLPGWPC